MKKFTTGSKAQISSPKVRIRSRRKTSVKLRLTSFHRDLRTEPRSFFTHRTSFVGAYRTQLDSQVSAQRSEASGVSPSRRRAGQRTGSVSRRKKASRACVPAVKSAGKRSSGTAGETVINNHFSRCLGATLVREKRRWREVGTGEKKRRITWSSILVGSPRQMRRTVQVESSPSPVERLDS